MKYPSLVLLGLWSATTTTAEKPPMTVEEKELAVLAGSRTPATRPGTQTITTRVVGGTTVTQASKYPFFVEWEDAKCGASLIWGGTYSKTDGYRV